MNKSESAFSLFFSEQALKSATSIEVQKKRLKELLLYPLTLGGAPHVCGS